MRYTALTPLVRGCVGKPSDPVFTDPLALRLKDIAWLFHRVRGWSYSGDVQIAGDPSTNVTFSGNFVLPSADEVAHYVTLEPQAFDTGGSSNPRIVFAFLLFARYGGGDPILDWSVHEPLINIIYSYTDPLTMIVRQGGVENQAIAGLPSAYTANASGTNALDSTTFSYTPAQMYYSNNPGLFDLEGSITLTANLYWAYEDAEGVPEYNTTTGALI